MWRAGSAHKQRTAVERGIELANTQPRPDVLSETFFAADDNTTVMRYTQLKVVTARIENDLDRSSPAAPPKAFPASADLSAEMFSLCRRFSWERGHARATCIALVEFRSPSAAAATSWIDEIAASAEETPASGLLSASFHLSAGGRRVLNYAEWADAGARTTALAGTHRSVARARALDASPGLQFTQALVFRWWRGARSTAGPRR